MHLKGECDCYLYIDKPTGAEH